MLLYYKSFNSLSFVCFQLVNKNACYAFIDHGGGGIRGHLGEPALFPILGSQGLNSGCQAWQNHLYPLSHLSGPKT